MSFTAKDCMSKNIKSVPPDMNAKEALKSLIESGASGLPVIDKEGSPIGVFTEKEILIAIMPVYLKKVGNFVYGEDSKAELRKLAHLEKFQVRDVMRKDVPTVTEETSLTEVSHIMLNKNERRVIVVKGKRAIGVITRADVVKALAREAGVSL